MHLNTLINLVDNILSLMDSIYFGKLNIKFSINQSTTRYTKMMLALLPTNKVSQFSRSDIIYHNYGLAFYTLRSGPSGNGYGSVLDSQQCT